MTNDHARIIAANTLWLSEFDIVMLRATCRALRNARVPPPPLPLSYHELGRRCAVWTMLQLAQRTTVNWPEFAVGVGLSGNQKLAVLLIQWLRGLDTNYAPAHTIQSMIAAALGATPPSLGLADRLGLVAPLIVESSRWCVILDAGPLLEPLRQQAEQQFALRRSSSCTAKQPKQQQKEEDPLLEFRAACRARDLPRLRQFAQDTSFVSRLGLEDRLASGLLELLPANIAPGDLPRALSEASLHSSHEVVAALLGRRAMSLSALYNTIYRAPCLTSDTLPGTKSKQDNFIVCLEAAAALSAQTGAAAGPGAQSASDLARAINAVFWFIVGEIEATHETVHRRSMVVRCERTRLLSMCRAIFQVASTINGTPKHQAVLYGCKPEDLLALMLCEYIDLASAVQVCSKQSSRRALAKPGEVLAVAKKICFGF